MILQLTTVHATSEEGRFGRRCNCYIYELHSEKVKLFARKTGPCQGETGFGGALSPLFAPESYLICFRCSIALAIKNLIPLSQAEFMVLRQWRAPTFDCVNAGELFFNLSQRFRSSWYSSAQKQSMRLGVRKPPRACPLSSTPGATFGRIPKHRPGTHDSCGECLQVSNPSSSQFRGWMGLRFMRT